MNHHVLLVIGKHASSSFCIVKSVRFFDTNSKYIPTDIVTHCMINFNSFAMDTFSDLIIKYPDKIINILTPNFPPIRIKHNHRAAMLVGFDVKSSPCVYTTA